MLAASAALLLLLARMQRWPAELWVAAAIFVALSLAAAVYGLRLRRIESAREVRVSISKSGGPILWSRFRGL